jgi:hypothetical protein
LIGGLADQSNEEAWIALPVELAIDAERTLTGAFLEQRGRGCRRSNVAARVPGIRHNV